MTLLDVNPITPAAGRLSITHTGAAAADAARSDWKRSLSNTRPRRSKVTAHLPTHAGDEGQTPCVALLDAEGMEVFKIILNYRR